ncbi:alpha/beta fold hydrolase [Alkalisalibacterium limincola]|nr:alpha/beta fold hydrolase [Alkalisalibacterium limincola]
MNATTIMLAPSKGPRPPRQLLALRLAHRVLGAVAPGVTSLVAERFWFTPPARRSNAGIEAFLDSGELLQLRVGCAHVEGRAWGEGPVALVMHGWGSESGRLQAVIEALVANGMRVVAFDAPGHGRSGPSEWGPRRAHLLEFGRTLLAAEHAFGPLHALVAHSGGCTAAAWAMQQGLRTRRVVLLAPLARPMDYAARFQRLLGFSDAVMRRWLGRAERRLGFAWDELDMRLTPSRVPVPPTLVVHDRDDTDTPWTDGEAVAEHWPDARLLSTQGLGHRGVLKDAGVLAELAAFLRASAAVDALPAPGREPSQGRRAGR